jgi:hypothetical protein
LSATITVAVSVAPAATDTPVPGADQNWAVNWFVFGPRDDRVAKPTRPFEFTTKSGTTSNRFLNFWDVSVCAGRVAVPVPVLV